MKQTRKLDNAALGFPVDTTNPDTSVFQISCVLKDRVDKNVLQEAVEKSINNYPIYQCTLKRGNFWYYFEKSDIQPIVKEYDGIPCKRLYRNNENVLLFQVTYKENTIYLEMFHALTDGTGAIQFLSEIVKNYLKIKYSLCLKEDVNSTQIQQEDSFSKYYSKEKQAKQIKQSEKAFQVKGERFINEEFKLYECTTSTKKLLDKAREYDTSITIYLTAVFLCAIADSIDIQKNRKPITLLIPINLRKFYSSQTMSNFFGWMEIEYLFSDGYNFKDVLEHVKKRFSQDLVKEQVATRMNKLIKLEKNPLTKFVPLFIKDFFIKLGVRSGNKNITGVLSNMGSVNMPDVCKPYIDRFGVLASTNRVHICSCSYDDKFYFSITSKLIKEDIQTALLEFLKKEGLDVSYK